MQVEYKGQDGSLGKVLVTGTLREVEAAKAITTRFNSIREEADGSASLTGSINKRERAQLDSLVLASNATPRTVATPAATTGQRYVELVAIAQRDRLASGKAWQCSLRDVERNSLPPEYEDQLVCYVYPAVQS